MKKRATLLELGLFSDGANLLSALNATDTQVSPRTAGRTTKQVETFIAVHLLTALHRGNRLEFPLRITQRERPDLLISMPGRDIGIEMTEATSEDWAKLCALSEREKPDALLEPGHFRPGASSRDTEALRVLLHQERLTSAEWIEDEPERAWAQFIFERVQIKLGKLQAAGFERFSENWLWIYDNLPLVPIELSIGLPYLSKRIEDFWKYSIRFNRIYILRSDVVIELMPESAHAL